MNWKLRKAFTGNNTSDVQTINGYIAAGEDNDFSVEVSPVGKEYPAPLVVPRTNLLLQSNQFDTTWINNLGAIGTISDNQNGYDGTNDAWLLSKSAAFGRLDQTIFSSGVQTYSLYAKANDSDWIYFRADYSGGIAGGYFNLATGIGGSFSNIIDSDITSVGNGWYRIQIVFNQTISIVRIYPAENNNQIAGTSGSIYIQDAQLETADKATEYIPTTTEAVTRSWDSFSRVQNQVPGICNGIHTHTGAASGGGIAATTITGTGSGGKFKYEFDTLGKLTLIEAMTHENLLLESNNFDDDPPWDDSSLGGTITGGQSGYDGTNDAWKIEKIAFQYRQINQSVSSSGVNTFSVYAKAGTLEQVSLFFRDAASNDTAVKFNLVTEAVQIMSVSNYISHEMVDVGGGWFRCSMTYEHVSGNIMRIYPDFEETDAGYIYIQDAQLESGTQATGYIDTTTAPVREGAGQGYKVGDKLSITTNEGHDIEFRLVEGSNATTVTVGMEATKPNKPVPFPVTKMRVSDSTDRQVLIMDQRSRYVFPKPTPYLLDSYEGAAAAYSLRRLRSAYTGPAVRVRRASNNDELDIYFDGQGNLDTASLEAFCAGTNGFVKVWYDQGPGGNDAEQTTTANQPKIYDSSTGVVTNGGRPAIEWDGTSQRLTNANEIMTGSSLCLIGVMQSDATTGLRMWVDQSGSNQGGTLFQDDPNYDAFARFGGTYIGLTNISTASTTHALFFANWVSGDSKAHINTTEVDSDTVSFSGSGNTGVPFWIGNDSQATSRAADGKLQEIIVYNFDQSANRTGIETNINDYYNIY